MYTCVNNNSDICIHTQAMHACFVKKKKLALNLVTYMQQENFFVAK